MKKPNTKLFNNKKVGRTIFKPIQRKDGTIYKDIDYFELLGRRCIELEKEHIGEAPLNYNEMGYDLDVVNVSKQVVKAIDEKRPRTEIERFLQSCINIE